MTEPDTAQAGTGALDAAPEVFAAASVATGHTVGCSCNRCDAVRGRATAHPESYCHRCGGANVSWSAPSPLWNQVMRGGDIDGPWEFDEIICPTCFAVLAEERGVATHWRLTADRVHAPLQTVTPSGRVWSDSQQLWVEPNRPTKAAGDNRW